MTPLDLRPLGIGEILDRAVTLFVRRFAVLILILALVAIPVAIVQYAAAPSTAGLIAELQRLAAVPAGHADERRAILDEITRSNRIGAFGVLLLLVSSILGALSTTACMIGIAQAYGGRLPSVREVYREAVRRWLPQVAAAIVFVGIAFVLTFVLLLIIFFCTLAIAALAQLSRPTAIVVGVPVAIVFAAVFFGSIVMLYFAAQMTVVSIALEDPNPIRGIANGFRRTFGPAVFWRSALVGTIVFGVSLIGSLMLLGVAAGLSAISQVSALYPVIAVTGGVALNALLLSFIVIYAVDVRVRREGYDLMLAAREAPFGDGMR